MRDSVVVMAAFRLPVALSFSVRMSVADGYWSRATPITVQPS